MYKIGGKVNCPHCGCYQVVFHEASKEAIRICGDIHFGGSYNFWTNCKECKQELFVNIDSSVRSVASKGIYTKEEFEQKEQKEQLENKFELDRHINNSINFLRSRNYLIEKPGEFKDSNITAISYAEFIRDKHPIISNNIYIWVREQLSK